MTDERLLSGAREWARLGNQVVRISATLAADDGAIDARRIVGLAAAAVGHATHVGLTLLPARGTPETIAVDDELPGRIDALQFRLKQGPCLEAADGETVLGHDLSHAPRWPEFAPRCTSVTSVRSIMSVPVPLPGHDRAALSFYSTSVAVFDELDLGVASVFPPFAAMALSTRLHEREVAQLGTALANSRQIGTAVGILMERYRVTSQQAFELLTRASQDANRKIRDLAAEIELTGELPAAPRPRRHPAGSGRRY